MFFKGEKASARETKLKYANTDYCLMVVKEEKRREKRWKRGNVKNKRVNRR